MEAVTKEYIILAILTYLLTGVIFYLFSLFFVNCFNDTSGFEIYFGRGREKVRGLKKLLCLGIIIRDAILVSCCYPYVLWRLLRNVLENLKSSFSFNHR